MSITSLKQQAQMALAKLTEGKRFLLSDLNERLRTAADENPQDAVIVAIAGVVEQIYNKNPNQIVSQGDIEKLYNELLGLNSSGTKFREVLGDLLITEKPKISSANEEHIKTIRDPVEELKCDVNYGDDLDNLFKSVPEKYNPQKAASAKEKIEMELRTLGFDKTNTKLAGGNKDFLLFSSELDTNQGPISVYIPTSASGEEFPEVFVAGDRFDKLNKENLSRYMLQKSAERSVSFESKFADSVDIPRVAPPEELKTIASNVEECVLESTIGYPQASVRLAKRMLVAELASMGFKGSQIRVAAPMADGFVCEADLNTPNGKITIELPTEMNGNNPLLPSVFAHGDFVDNFTAAKLQAFVINKTGSDELVVKNSGLYGLNLSQLKDVIVKSAMDGKFAACDEAIEVVAQTFDEDTYRAVIADYHELLVNLGGVKDNLAQSFDDSDQFVKTPNSIYPIHKKLGRPAHELIRDENGKYHLKSTYDARKKNAEAGAFFSNAKALIGE